MFIIADNHPTHRLCNKCNEMKTISNYHKGPGCGWGIGAVCKKCLSEYGNVIELNYDGAKVEMNFYDLTSDTEEREVEEALDECDDDFACAFYDLVRNNQIDKPKDIFKAMSKNAAMPIFAESPKILF